MRVLALVAAVASFTLSTAAQTPRRELAPIFDAYEQRQYDAAIAEIKRQSDLKSFATRIDRESRAWIADAPDRGADRRRLVVATVALEAINRHGLSQWGQAMVLLEWACTQIRRAAPGAAELAWHRASFALMQGGADESSLLEVHVGHAFKRFPDDSQVLLARAVAREMRTFPDPREGNSLTDRDGRVDQILDYLQEAMAHPDTRAEAAVRLGFTFLRVGQVELAVKTLASTDALTVDPYFEYLGHLFRGRALERLNRDDDAVAAYRAATKIVPGAQTAGLALAAALVKTGQRTAAAEVGQQLVTIAKPPMDPWFVYGKTGTRFWPLLLNDLREALR